MARQADSTPLNAEQRELAVRFLGLASSRIRHYSSAWPRYDSEIESAGYMALVIAARNFEASQGIAKNFVWRSVDLAIYDAIRDEEKQSLRLKVRHGKPFTSKVALTRRRRARGLQDIEVKAMHVVGVDDRDEAAWVMARLTIEQTLVLRLVVHEGLSQAKAGERLGISQMTASRLVASARAACGVRAGR